MFFGSIQSFPNLWNMLPFYTSSRITKYRNVRTGNKLVTLSLKKPLYKQFITYIQNIYWKACKQTRHVSIWAHKHGRHVRMWAHKHAKHAGMWPHKHARHIGTWARQHARHAGKWAHKHTRHTGTWGHITTQARQGINQTLEGPFNGPFPIEVSRVLSQLGLPKISISHKIEK